MSPDAKRPGEQRSLDLAAQDEFLETWNAAQPPAPDLPIEPRHVGRPYARGRPTSHGAALGDRTTMRARVLKVIRRHGPVTDEEIAQLLEVSDSNATRPRRLELQRAGMIEAAGRKPTRSGRSAIAWKTPGGDR